MIRSVCVAPLVVLWLVMAWVWAQAPEAAPRPPDDARRPVPDDVEVEEALGLVKQAYEDEYTVARQNPAPLIQKLLAAAERTQDPARQFALLLAAEDAAAAGGDHSRVMEIIAIRSDQFAIDGLQARLDRLASFVSPKEKPAPEALLRLYDHAMAVAENSIEQEMLMQAKSAAELALNMSRSILLAGRAKKNDAIAADGDARQARAKQLLAVVERRSRAMAAYDEAIKTLEGEPDDPMANEIAGTYLCFHRGDWASGLPRLSKSATQAIAQSAAQEVALLAIDAPDAKDVFSLAGQWWTASEDPATSVDARTQLKAHATDLYKTVLEEIGDPLDKAIAEKRVRSVKELTVKSDRRPKLPRAKREPRTLVLSMNAEGSGVFVFRSTGAVYRHKHWGGPGEVRINGQPWTNLSETPPEWAKLVATVNPSTARVVAREGRDTIALESADGGFDLHVSDSPNGGAAYSVTIEFAGGRW